MLNIASVNMPKIKPETKVLIIKTPSPSLLLKLQISSMCLNSRWRGFASATKRLATSKTACWSGCQKPDQCQPPHSSRRSGRQRCLFHQELYVGFLLAMVSTVVLLPRNQRVNKRQLRNRVVDAKAHSLTEGWTAEKWWKKDFSDESSIELHPKCCQYCRRPSGARQDPRFTQKTVKFGGGKIKVWG